MKTAIVYYSFTGNTHRLAQIIGDIIKNKGEEIVPVRIRPLKEETNFLKQCKDAFLNKKPKLYKTLLDLKYFDRIIIGSPVWAFKPAPAINTYLEQCQFLEGKKVICFVTYGSGTGKDKALQAMKKLVAHKGGQVIGSCAFQQAEKLEQCVEKLSKIL